jgi:hypothetical protein
VGNNGGEVGDLHPGMPPCTTFAPFLPFDYFGFKGDSCREMTSSLEKRK